MKLRIKDTLTHAYKNDMCDFINIAMGRVCNADDYFNRYSTNIVPQGVSIYRYTKDGFKYIYTKDSEIRVYRDDANEVEYCLNSYTLPKVGDVYMYMNKCMLPLISYHMKHHYR